MNKDKYLKIYPVSVSLLFGNLLQISRLYFYQLTLSLIKSNNDGELSGLWKVTQQLIIR